MSLITMISRFTKNNWIIGIGFPIAICLILSSCSNNDAGNVYDEALSNTTWQRTSLDLETPTTSIEEQLFVDIPKEILDRLEYDNVRTEQKTDTVNKNVAQTKESLLSFGNDENCQLKDIIRYKGTYQLETLEVEIRHYPNQTHSIGDNQRQTTEIIIEDDSLIVKRLYDGMLMRADTILFGIGNERKYKSTSIDVSEPFDYELGNKVETYHMTYTRNGNRLELVGDKNLSGVISEDFSEIDFEEIGIFGIY